MDLTIKINLDGDAATRSPIDTIQTLLETIRFKLEYTGNVNSIDDMPLIDINGAKIGRVTLTNKGK